MQSKKNSEVKRLEELWGGDFGAAYVERNANAANGREPFWSMIFAQHSVGTALEIGCNIGANLHWIAKAISPTKVYGVDINEEALAQLHGSLSKVNAIWSPARELPFRDNWFDLVFTSGVLIHQPDSTLPLVMAEAVRCSSKYVLCIEYFSEKPIEVPYRGERGALFKRPYGELYQELFPDLKLLTEGFLGRDQGWDDVTYWMFEKTR